MHLSLGVCEMGTYGPLCKRKLRPTLFNRPLKVAHV
jgi:hypothetical protein